MEGLLDFARGPLFRFSFIIMILGLARILFIDLFNAWTAYRKAGDKSMPWKLVISRSLEWLIPVKRIGHNRSVYSVISIIFHVGLLLVPIFLLAHVQLWKGALGVYWPTLSYKVAYWLTMSTIIAGTFLIIGRIFNSTSSFLSRKQDFLWPIILLVPFVTGFVCANVAVSPGNYKLLMLIHVLAGDLIFMLIPFTKIAHCVLMPLSQFISTLAWKFPPETDDAIATTLKKKGAPV